MSLDITAEFLGVEFKKSLNNLHSILDATTPLAEQLVTDQKFKQTIAKFIEALQVLLSQAQNEDEEWAKRQEQDGWNQLTQSEQRQKCIQDLLNKKNLTPDDKQKLTELEQLDGWS